MRGELIKPGGPTYDEHRKVWNGSIKSDFQTAAFRPKHYSDSPAAASASARSRYSSIRVIRPFRTVTTT